MIRFEKWTEEAVFHNPLKGFDRVPISLEIRKDPLTGYVSVINNFLKNKQKLLFPDTDYNYLEEIGTSSKEKCFMCDERWDKLTPYYPEDFLPDKRPIKGNALLFPNLYPLSKFHAVVRLGSKHFRKMNELTSEILRDGLILARDFLLRSHEYDPRYKYATMNANFMFPSGASATHPHFQIMNFFIPSTYHNLLLEKSRDFFENTGECYFERFVEIESSSRRWIRKIGESCWIAAYSPIGRNEIQVIWPHKQNISQFEAKDFEDLAQGLSSLFAFFHTQRISTYNFSLFSAPLGEDIPYFRCIMKIVNRQNVVPHHRTDDYFFQKLLKNELSAWAPEDLASEIRTFLEKK